MENHTCNIMLIKALKMCQKCTTIRATVKKPVEVCNVSSGHWQAETILLERDATSTTTINNNFVLFSHVVILYSFCVCCILLYCLVRNKPIDLLIGNPSYVPVCHPAMRTIRVAKNQQTVMNRAFTYLQWLWSEQIWTVMLMFFPGTWLQL